MKTSWKYFLILLLIIAATVWFAVFSFSSLNLRIIACDVGQGDATLIVYGSFELLTDGGNPNGMAMDCLSKHMPFWDRELEVIVNTHPQLDHYGGLIEVVKNYRVDYFVANALENSSQEYQLLIKEVGSRGVSVINPLKGQSIRYGKMHYDIFWPTEMFLIGEGWNGDTGKLSTFTSKRDPNDFSVQAVLSFGNFKALLTGDVGQNMADLVIPNFNEKSINYIKIPHHGSKYGLTTKYLDLFKPDLAVISVGKKNRYGHPTTEVLSLLKENAIKTLRTDESGDVVLVTDGRSYRIDQ